MHIYIRSEIHQHIYVAQKADSAAVGGVMLKHMANGIDKMLSAFNMIFAGVVAVGQCIHPQIKMGAEFSLLEKKLSVPLKCIKRLLEKVVRILAGCRKPEATGFHYFYQVVAPGVVVQNIYVAHLAHLLLRIIISYNASL